MTAAQELLVKRMLAASLVCYVVACALPIYREEDIRGISALLMGWMGMFSPDAGPFLFAWLANPLYIITIITVWKKKKVSLWLSVAGVLLAVCFLGINRVIINEGGTMIAVSPGIAFPVWMLAIILAMFAAALNYRYKRAG